MTDSIDILFLKREFSTSPEILQEAFALFLELSDQMLSAVEMPLINKQYSELQFAAHTLKGSVANIGGVRVKEVAYAIEQAAKVSDDTQLLILLDTLKIELEILHNAIRKFDVHSLST